MTAVDNSEDLKSELGLLTRDARAVGRKKVDLPHTRAPMNLAGLADKADPLGGSFSGRTADSDSASLDSNPSPPTNSRACE